MSRLGSKGDAEEVVSHPFFRSLDFAQLLEKVLESPFKPDVK